MTLRHRLQALALSLMLAASPAALAEAAGSTPATTAQRSFTSPEQAASELAEAIRADDRKKLLAIVGPGAAKWLFSGDAVADRADMQTFLQAYDAGHHISQTGDGRALLLVGTNDWPFPAPLLRDNGGWRFDAKAGGEEIINRRIGKNELNTLQTLLAIVDAQREYAMDDLDGNGFNDYARRIMSTPGMKDGLYWPVAGNEPVSPLGPLIAAATLQGYGQQKHRGAQRPAPYHGYHFRLLTRQGPEAPGGAYSYLVGDKLIGGFAVIAYPARYGASGVMSFIVSHDGVVYEKNLGPATARQATNMAAFNPDSSWTKSQ